MCKNYADMIVVLIRAYRKLPGLRVTKPNP